MVQQVLAGVAATATIVKPAERQGQVAPDERTEDVSASRGSGQGNDPVPGDVVTVEPGLYRSGYGGLRLEDLVLVTDDGYEVITDYPYDLRP